MRRPLGSHSSVYNCANAGTCAKREGKGGVSRSPPTPYTLHPTPYTLHLVISGVLVFLSLLICVCRQEGNIFLGKYFVRGRGGSSVKKIHCPSENKRLCHIIIHTTCYVTSSYTLCHIIRGSPNTLSKWKQKIGLDNPWWCDIVCMMMWHSM